MGRKNRNQDSSMDAAGDSFDPNELQSPDGPADASSPPSPPAADPMRTVALEVPVFGGVINGYCSNHVDIRLSPDQAELLRRITMALDAAAERHADGRLVNSLSAGDAVRWMLGRLSRDFAGNQQAAEA